eukprot:scpid64523/ scgid22610/ 
MARNAMYNVLAASESCIERMQLLCERAGRCTIIPGSVTSHIKEWIALLRTLMSVEKSNGLGGAGRAAMSTTGPWLQCYGACTRKASKGAGCGHPTVCLCPEQ